MSSDIIERAEKLISDDEGVTGTTLQIIHEVMQDRHRYRKMIRELIEYCKDLEPSPENS